MRSRATVVRCSLIFSVLSDAERLVLENWARRRTTAQGLAKRARIVLVCARGWGELTR
ncbi:hypothetical protein [Streptomyces sp. NPDC001642]|uniref:hypothetical protein n=1 Tax=Streptomyces sp. NPDC001642 TaxID=3154392 RepID=UPI003318FBE6